MLYLFSKMLKLARLQNEKTGFILHSTSWMERPYCRKDKSGQFPLWTIYITDIASNATIPIRKPFGANRLVESDAVGNGAEFVKRAGSATEETLSYSRLHSTRLHGFVGYRTLCCLIVLYQGNKSYGSCLLRELFSHHSRRSRLWEWPSDYQICPRRKNWGFGQERQLGFERERTCKMRPFWIMLKWWLRRFAGSPCEGRK